MAKPEIIRVTKEFRFEMAHTLYGYDGPCKNIHGHSYHLSVTLKGRPLQQPGNPKDGMVMDFGILKKITAEEVVAPFDHALALNAAIPAEEIDMLKKYSDKIIVFPFQPSCENLVIEIKNRLQKRLASLEDIYLFSVRLHETDNSYAEWVAEDNLLCRER